jgi:hypothetical protein
MITVLLTEGALAVRYLSAEVSVSRGVESLPEKGEVERR